MVVDPLRGKKQNDPSNQNSNRIFAQRRNHGLVGVDGQTKKLDGDGWLALLRCHQKYPIVQSEVLEMPPESKILGYSIVFRSTYERLDLMFLEIHMRNLVCWRSKTEYNPSQRNPVIKVLEPLFHCFH